MFRLKKKTYFLNLNVGLFAVWRIKFCLHTFDGVVSCTLGSETELMRL